MGVAMKQFVLFKWEDHNAGGGWNDYSDSFLSLADAVAEGKKHEAAFPGWNCWQVVDTVTRTVVAES